MRQFNKDFFAGWLTGVATIMAAILVGLLMSCAPGPTGPRIEMPVDIHPPGQTSNQQPHPGHKDPVYAVSGTVNIDQPETYPPMPESAFSYVEAGAVGSRVHYTTVGALIAVELSGSSRTIDRTGQTTVMLFADGTGLVLLCRWQPQVSSGDVWIDYSVPPVWDGSPTAVLIHSIRRN